MSCDGFTEEQLSCEAMRELVGADQPYTCLQSNNSSKLTTADDSKQRSVEFGYAFPSLMCPLSQQ